MNKIFTLFLLAAVGTLSAQNADCPPFPNYGFIPGDRSVDSKQFASELTGPGAPGTETDYVAAVDGDMNIVGCGMVAYNSSRDQALVNFQIFNDFCEDLNGDNMDDTAVPSAINCDCPAGNNCETFQLYYFDASADGGAGQFYPVLDDNGNAREYPYEDMDNNNVLDGFGALQAVTGGSTSNADPGNSFDTFEEAFTAANDGSLPVSWESFTGRHTGKVVELDWATSLEEDNVGFDVERSLDSEVFEMIGHVAGNNEASMYDFVDNDPREGVSYYRLRQRDFDGTESFSPIITVQGLQVASVAAILFPNPATGSVNLRLTGDWKETVDVQLADQSGRVVRKWTSKVDALRNLPISGIAAGVYHLQVLDGEHTNNQRLVIR